MSRLSFNKNILFGTINIGPDEPVFIIAEAGVNHGGDIDVAKKLIDVANEAGANAVKFQAFRTKHLIVDGVEKAPYQKNTTDKAASQSDMLRTLELTTQHYRALVDHCKLRNILFLITPFDEESLQELEDIGVEAYKIASTDTTNLPFLKKLAQTGKPLFFSTGMCYLDEVTLALEEIGAINKQVVLLQCTANYPIEDNEANIAVLKTYDKKYDILLGYSDHSCGVGAAPYAVAAGAKVLEKHFTLDNNLEGPDHAASLCPSELKAFVAEVRKVEAYLGDGVKAPTASEIHTRQSLQKSMVARCDIAQGEFLGDQNVVAKRTGGRGISPLKYKSLFGQASLRHYAANEIIEEGEIDGR